VNAAAIVAEARTWLGVRWLHQGRSREGVDCAGLVIEVTKAVLGSTFDIRDYPRVATDEQMIEICDQYMDRIAFREVQPGDLMVFAYDRQRHMAVVGDYVHGGLSIIHAYSLAPRRVIETRLDEKWVARMLRAYRFRESEVR
jgi:cell wall-associated NlpC family hydrolase